MTKTFTPGRPIWCAGCGDFAVQGVLEKSLDSYGIKRHNLMLLTGIGCSGTVQNNVQCYGYHSLHGRVLPTSIGVKLANPTLTVVAAGGDGDGFAIGGGHLVHTFKSNPSITYIVMNNSNYGLTKGQPSPTSPTGYRSNVEENMDAIMLGLSIPSTTFLARGFSGHPEQLEELMIAAIKHTEEGHGFAFLEVLSPCVTYYDTHREWRFRVFDVNDDENYDATDRAGAFKKMIDIADEGRIPIGLLFKNEHASLESLITSSDHPPAALQDIESQEIKEEYRKTMDAFLG
ncbi:MAG: 2-oxoacid:ferredoxin oxidoreductase subunit beta [Candidatus Dadabacteria bacterium]|nr:2-oxoacid:ferredoxin oxidoreductase subunit beta [Candidatus Dadabacteria bacterium]NIS07872.1 2-oxoacid:ferredoxin oxidoreductase subunit beta [Candidatus Dadabacteria bacterium]NIV42892.1 2-oxoacid:ferredoxin oxidoreductase subunit beta [Candidatus Dadabacteria bacterium]NIX14862.1 2-oxoacid:ferredoxin oxidoreductase subunit beta [Candidatus Dadabacteria bacterium]NIY21476.1 2-oxoacid:ferredoxin oxidoreductase subunit beta [Candidatus Dadabacteria bacterium]